MPDSSCSSQTLHNAAQSQQPSAFPSCFACDTHFIRPILRVSVLLLPLASKWDLPCFASFAALHAVLGTKHTLWECLSHEFNPGAKYLSAISHPRTHSVQITPQIRTGPVPSSTCLPGSRGSVKGTRLGSGP